MSTDWAHFYFPSKIVYEKGSANRIGEVIRNVGNRVLLISVQNEIVNREAIITIKNSVDQYTKGCILYDDFEKQPGFDELDTAAHFTKQSKADVVMAVGSRETFYTARAIALLSENEVFASELSNHNFPLSKPPLPVITVPTMPSMGEEATPTISIYDEDSNTVFYGIDKRLYPELIYVDPEIAEFISDNDMSRSGVAILAAGIESILSQKSNEISTSVALKALELISDNLHLIVNEPNNMIARHSITMASLFVGMAHANSNLGICFSIASAVSNQTNLDIYRAMAILLPHVMDFNLTVSAGKYIHIAKAMNEDIKDITVIEAAIKAVEGVRKIYSEMNIPMRLSDFEIRKSDLVNIATMAMQYPIIKNSNRNLDRGEVETILISAY